MESWIHFQKVLACLHISAYILCTFIISLFAILSKIIEGKINTIKPVSEFKKLFGLRLDNSITPSLGLLMQNKK